jgi:hypothetical protein
MKTDGRRLIENISRELIIIPTAYRVDYLTALKAFSRNTEMTPLLRMLDYARRYTHAIDWAEMGKRGDQVRRQVEFHRPREFGRRCRRLEFCHPDQRQSPNTAAGASDGRTRGSADCGSQLYSVVDRGQTRASATDFCGRRWNRVIVVKYPKQT